MADLLETLKSAELKDSQIELDISSDDFRRNQTIDYGAFTFASSASFREGQQRFSV